MSFDENRFKETLGDYLNDCVTVEIVNYHGDQNPIGTEDLGINVDVGETHSFDLHAVNNGPIGLLNVQVQISARRGKVSNSYSEFVNFAGSHWLPPWHDTTVVRAFNLAPGQNYLHKHEFSGGHLFGYNAEEPTGGSDNNRIVEELLSAKIFAWQPDLSTYGFVTKDGPLDTWETFIQRS